MLLTKQQIQKLYNLLNLLIDDKVDVNQIKFAGDDKIVLAEAVKGEIENRGWRVTPEGEVKPILSFFHD